VGGDYSPEIGNITLAADRGTFLARIRDYGDTFPAVPEVPELDVEWLPSGDVRITFDGSLESRPAGGGDWGPTDLTSPATLTPTGAGIFYRAVR
jgi:hypothetical protein